MNIGSERGNMKLTESEPIAIIGSSCRFPGGADSTSRLWDLLKNPRDLLRDIPFDRFNTKGFYHEDGEHHGRTNVTKSYFLDEDYTDFDHAFFQISPREAESMDPQQKILLEVVYESIESAGYSLNFLRGSSTGVFIGQMTNDYYDIVMRDVDSAGQYTSTGISRAIMANRVSYFFDWRGPSMNIDTACSSSLVALHQAVQSLRSGESQLAVVGGVNLILGPEMFIYESKLHMLSPSGRCKMWDSKADGYARGEGFAVVVLKTLKQAIADNDGIECVIRGTGINQDGQTQGLTVPSATAQTQLIQSTYQKCGLDYSNPQDRCQYFEAHGTGTLAGDVKEAEAIHNAFFRAAHTVPLSDDGLYVGSVKTVIGHLEGAAGLAGLLKAMLAIKEGAIPPNMHFQELNPAIRPFDRHLRVPVTLQPWPRLDPGAVRRASVNSFGFGGTNVHVIIEGWGGEEVNTELDDQQQMSPNILHGPVVLSAASETSLRKTIRSLAETIKSNGNIDFGDLCWTLQSRRAEFQHRAAFAALEKNSLISMLDSVNNDASRNILGIISSAPINVSKSFPLRILGVFTGQGAQWPTMGADLYVRSAVFRHSVDHLDSALRDIQKAPLWSLREQILAPAEDSKVHLAEVAQPLTTSLQIALVDLLRACGVHFSAAVGHSSGEIAAAYASGYIKSVDAIRIAYYRGLVSRLSTSSNGQAGLMMAAAMSSGDANIEICQQSRFKGRVGLAAINSKQSVTFSGDADAITEVKTLLDAQGVFARVLRIDKAYHSHHMMSCVGEYSNLLHLCAIQPQRMNSEDLCTWSSSVHGLDSIIHDWSALSCQYWVDNMVQPVLFADAITRLIREENPFDMAIEVGPHPALQGPTQEIIKGLTGVNIPYHGLLKRGDQDGVAFANALGFIWTNTQSDGCVIHFAGLKDTDPDRPRRKHRVQKNIPSYEWDRKYSYMESVKSKAWRTRIHVHSLLGTATKIGPNHEMHWSNILKLGEIDWLNGHKFQDQVIFPAAGYISMVIDAAIRLADGDLVCMIELNDFKLHHAVVFENGSRGVQINFSIRLTHRTSCSLTTEYSCSIAPVDVASPMPEQLTFTGSAKIILGKPGLDSLPAYLPLDLPLDPVDVGRFYRYMREIGLDYSGLFLVDSVYRRLRLSEVRGKWLPSEEFAVHPASLDAAFHGLFAAHSFPGDGMMRNACLPTSIDRLRVSMAQLRSKSTNQKFVANTHITEISQKGFQGDIDIYSVAEGSPILQLQGITCSSFTPAGENDDVLLFARTVWVQDVSTGLNLEDSQEVSPSKKDLFYVCERTALFYLRHLIQNIDPKDVSKLDATFQHLVEWAEDLFARISSGHHKHMRAEWVNDRAEIVSSWKQSYTDCVDLELVHCIGESLAAIIRGKVPALQVMMENNMLARYYNDGIISAANHQLASICCQLAHRYPKMRIIEVGAGTGAVSGLIFKELAGKFESYTFTDISSSFFEQAQVLFPHKMGKVNFRVLDIEQPPSEQGFEPHSFDLVIASNVLHATKSLSDAATNCRELLRSGGYLLLLEVTAETVRIQFPFSCLPGWWRGRDDGRTYSPVVSEETWHSVLSGTGFSGIDKSCKDSEDESTYSFSTILSQAGQLNLDLGSLLIIGGSTLPVANIVSNITTTLQSFAEKIYVFRNLEDITEADLDASSAVVCLADLDSPCLKDLTSKVLKAMQTVFCLSKYILWVTRGCHSDDPTNGSLVTVPAEHTFDLNQDGDSVELLEVALDVILCKALLTGLTGTFWAHDANPSLARVLTEVARSQEIGVFFSQSSSAVGSEALYIHPNTPDRDLKLLVPHDATRFCCLVVRCLPSFTYCSLRRSTVSVNIGMLSKQSPVLPCAENVIDWVTKVSVEARIQPLNVEEYLFSDRTYFLCGLTGEVGLSLCEWLAQHGARHFALASRNPKTEPQMIRHLQNQGADVRTFSVDICNKDVLLDVHQQIIQSMPPISGVVNGAMVLRDMPFNAMSLEDFTAVLNPKVQGSMNLDEIFHSDDLDFFILFSSLAGVVGNAGQSNYAAASLFMSTLAASRRKRGLAASAIDIGMVLGVGYVARSIGRGDSVIEPQLRRHGYLALSETNLHTIFMEAILSGKPNSGHSHELITGLGMTRNAPWAPFPRLSHYAQTPDPSTTQQSLTHDNHAPNISEELSRVSNSEEALFLLEAAFQAQLGVILQTTISDADKTKPLAVLGADSLIAVEIRSWFLKGFAVDIPVFKILGGASLVDLCQEVMGNSSVIPQVVKATQKSIPRDGSEAHTSSISLDALAVSGTPLNHAVAVDHENTPKRFGALSHSQARIYFQQQFVDDQSTYNFTCIGILRGKPAIARLEAALRMVSLKHESLRTIQIVNSNPRILLRHIQIDKLSRFVLDISQGETLLAAVLSKSDLENAHHIIFVYHHVAMDGFSWPLFLEDLEHAYAGRDLGKPVQQAIELSERRRTEYFWRSRYHQLPKTSTLNSYELVKQIASHLGVTPFHFYVATMQVFLAYSDSNRSEIEDLETVGCFLNMLPLRSTRTRDMILDDLQVPRSTNYHPLFQVVVNYRNQWLTAIPSRNPTLLSLSTQMSLYESADSERFLKCNPSIREAICSGKGSELEVTWPGTLIHQVERIASMFPTSIAMKDGYGSTLTYDEMMTRASQISNQLCEILLSPGSYVGVYLQPTTDSMCCLLAITRLGCVWVPLDPRSPRDRLRIIAMDCDLQAIICDAKTKAKTGPIAGNGIRVVNLDISTKFAPVITDNMSKIFQPATCLYTSGSTGIPKGVIFVSTQQYDVGKEIVLQQGSTAFDLALDRIFAAFANGGTLIIVSEEDRGNPTRIAELMEMEKVTYTTFVPSEYTAILNYGTQFLKRCTNWRFAFSGGEKITPHLRKGFKTLGLAQLKLINLYGPTETSISCAKGVVPYWTENDIWSRSDSLWSLHNYTLLVANSNLNVLPVGMAGEVCIAGVGVANGYLNRPEETSLRFLEAGKTSATLHLHKWLKGCRMYRTGDLGRILEDGSLNILGRIGNDGQVKIRGYRVELDEIANVILKTASGAIIDAAASYRPTLDLLVAFVTFDGNFIGDQGAYLADLQSQILLPPYMCPALIIPVVHLPMNINGKKDRRAIDELPIDDAVRKKFPDFNEDDGTFDSLANTEMQVAEVWKEVLGRHVLRSRKITAESDFFHMGGNSMLLVKLRHLLQYRFGTKVSLPELFQSSTLSTMSARIDAHTQDGNTTTQSDMDWSREVAALCHGLPQAQDPIAPEPRQRQVSRFVVLLTGATGFLGHHILRRLVDDDRVKEIHCVAIRPDTQGVKRHVTLTSQKIVEYTGDLTNPSIGLSESDVALLSKKVDLIIHSAAEVAYLRTYQSLRAANVLSTRFLCELALPRKIALHFISSAAVARFTSHLLLPEISVSGSVPPPGTPLGYAASKWVSEALLEKIALDHGLPIWVHRSASMIGDGASNLDFIAALLKFSRLLKTVPRMWPGSTNGYFDMIDVREVADQLVQQALSTQVHEWSNVRPAFMHHCREAKIAPEKLRDYIGGEESEEYEEVDMQTWVQLAMGMGLNPLIRDYMMSATSGGRSLSLHTVTKVRN
ncbi:polyketide synthase [Hypoxylon sp. FL1857]|nr:polyketide synthase [Hypoxylon sp. FL1857]